MNQEPMPEYSDSTHEHDSMFRRSRLEVDHALFDQQQLGDSSEKLMLQRPRDHSAPQGALCNTQGVKCRLGIGLLLSA